MKKKRRTKKVSRKTPRKKGGRSPSMQRVGAATLKVSGKSFRVTLYIPRNGGNFGLVKGLKSE